MKLVDLASLLRLAVETVRPAAQVKSVELLLSLEDPVEPIMADEERLQQVVWNLLSNAIKFTPASGMVVISLRSVDSFVELKVRDTGQGLSQEFLPYVFDRFQQADSSSSRKHGGLGLGLSIARNLVELHGGTISATSPGIGLGSTFSVQLPLQSPTGQPKRAEAKVSAAGETHLDHQEEQVRGASALQGMRILLVEDMEDSREMVTAILSRQGAQVQEAGSAKEAMLVLERWLPDVIVCDIGMPTEDGYSFIGRVRALPADVGGKIPAIALTAYGRLEDRIKALSSGFQNHIVKPPDPAELVASIVSLK